MCLIFKQLANNSEKTPSQNTVYSNKKVMSMFLYEPSTKCLKTLYFAFATKAQI